MTGTADMPTHHFFNRRDTRKVADYTSLRNTASNAFVTDARDVAYSNSKTNYGSTKVYVDEERDQKTASLSFSDDSSLDVSSNEVATNLRPVTFTKAPEEKHSKTASFCMPSNDKHVGEVITKSPEVIPKPPLSTIQVDLKPQQAQRQISPLGMDVVDGNKEVRNRPRSSSESGSSLDTLAKPSLHRRHSSSIPAFRQGSDLDTLTKTLQLRQRQLGPYSPKVAIIYNLIGNIHFRGREYEFAIEAYLKAISCEKGAKAPIDFAPIASAFGNLATVYRSMGDGERSSMCLERALNLHVYIAKGQKRDPNESVEVSNCLYQVGLTQNLRKRYHKALDTLSHCRLTREKILGSNHVDVARTVDAMGKAYLGLGDFEKAMSCHQEAFIMKKRSGSNRSDSGYLVSLTNIAQVHEARGAVVDAIAVYLKVNASQKSDLANLRIESRRRDPKVTRLALETGETLLKLKELYFLSGEDAASINKGREAALYFKEAGIRDDDTRVLTCWARGKGVWNSV